MSDPKEAADSRGINESKEVAASQSETTQLGDLATQDTSNEKIPSLSDDVSLTDSDKSHVMLKSFGVRRAELIMAQMTNNWLKVAFFFTVFLGQFIITIEYNVVAILVGYATNSYRQHSLMSTIRVVSYVASAGSYLFFARAADIFGRLPLSVIALLFRIMGLIIQAKATDVQKYAAGSVFWGIGNSGQVILWQICLSDASTLKYRVLAVAVLSCPFIIATWSIGEINTQILTKHSWSWGIALWAYVTTLVCSLFLVVYTYLLLKARKTETWKQLKKEEDDFFHEGNARAQRYRSELAASTTKVGKLVGQIKVTLLRSLDDLYSIFWRIDLIGIILVVLFFGLFLVPLTLAGGFTSKWRQASTIVPLVLTVVALPLFIIWEKWVTTRPLLPFKVMKDRGVWAAFLVAIFTTFIFGMPAGFSYPVLMVGMNADIVVASRTPTLSMFTEGFAIPVIGYIVSKVRRTKAFVFLGCAFIFVSLGIFVHFRGTNDGIRAKYFRDGVAIGMCFIGVADACLLRVACASVQSCTNHEYMASVTALFSMSYLIGAALASCVSGAIWTQQMYGTIYRKMVELGVDPIYATSAYAEPFTFITVFPWGTPQRRAVALAYAEIQRKLCIVGLCLCVPLLVIIFFLRDHRLPGSQNLGDKDKTLDPEQAEAMARRDKSQVVFTDDKDYILIGLKKAPGLPKKLWDMLKSKSV